MNWQGLKKGIAGATLAVTLLLGGGAILGTTAQAQNRDRDWRRDDRRDNNRRDNNRRDNNRDWNRDGRRDNDRIEIIIAIGNADGQKNALALFNALANWSGVGSRNCRDVATTGYGYGYPRNNYPNGGYNNGRSYGL